MPTYTIRQLLLNGFSGRLPRHSPRTRVGPADRRIPRLERLEDRSVPASIYDLEVIARSGQNGLASITQYPSINDSGQVAFVAALAAGGEGIFVGDGTAFPTNVTQVIDPNRTYLASVQINNSGQVLASQRDFSPNFRRLQLWDVDQPGTAQSQAGSGVSGTSIFSFATLNNDGESVFAAIPSAGSNVKLSVPTPPLGFGTQFHTLPAGPQPNLRPMLADDGTVVFRNGNAETDSIVTRPAAGGSSATIAGFPNFSQLGSAPGISDDGIAVAFYGDLSAAGAASLNSANPEGAPLLAPGAGIFVSLKTLSGVTAVVRIAGKFDNGYLDPGERWDNRGPNWNADVLAGTSLRVDAHEDGNLDGGAAVGIREFDPNMRVGVNREAPDSPFYRVVFAAKDADEMSAVFSARVRADAKDLFAPVPVVRAGDLIPGFGLAGSFSLFDPVNANGQIAVAVNLQGPATGTAVVKVSGKDPVRQTMTPSGAALYAPDRLSEYIGRVMSFPEHPQSAALLSALQLLQQSGEYSIRRKGCLLTSFSMALDRMGVAHVSPAGLFAELNAIDGFTPITSATAGQPYANGVTKFKFQGANLDYAKLEQRFGVRVRPVLRTNGVLETASLAAAIAANHGVLLNIHKGGHWVYATAINGQTITYIDPEASTSTATQTIQATDPTLKQYRIVSPGAGQPQVILHTHSPIQTLVTTPGGLRVGTDAGGVTYNEVPGAGMGTEYPILDPEDGYTDAELAALESDVPRLITIPTFEPGVYQVSTFGTASGPFSIDMTALLGAGGAVSRSITGTATPGSAQTFALDLGAPVVTSEPADRLVAAGDNASFTAVAVGSPAPTVQWQVSTDQGTTYTNVPGATASALSFASTAGQNGNLYRAVFSNSGGTATSDAAKLTVATAPVVTANPTHQIANTGGRITLTATAVGSPAPTVQWQRSTNGGTTFTDVAGATSPTYSATITASGVYRAVFSNANGTATTTAASATMASTASNVVVGGSGARFPQVTLTKPAGLAGGTMFAVATLPNGNVVMSVGYNTVLLYDGKTGRPISTFQTDGDYFVVTVLTDGNFVVISPTNAVNGSVTWINGTTGLNGSVSAANSLIGISQGGASSYTSGIVTPMPDGGYLVGNSNWHDGVGFVTRCNADGTTVGVVSAANSLVGETAGDYVGGGGGFTGRVVVLANGNYAVSSTYWGGGRGAVTWGNGKTGITGVVSEANSLVGTSTSDSIGWLGVRALPNGNFVVPSPYWNGSAGAVTWVNGATGLTGPVNSTNSLVGTTTYDRVGESVVVLTNGNYVTYTGSWDSYRGAVTWGNGAGGVVGVVSSANSLVGDVQYSYISYYGSVVPLMNGNYVVASPIWNNYRGAVTWGNGTTGSAGIVSAANSIIGTQPYVYPNPADSVGSDGVTALANGNYVVASPAWSGGRGAITWANGTVPTSLAVSQANSLVGGAATDQVGIGGVQALTNGNYVVVSPDWGYKRGAVTWGNGTLGVSGLITAANSLVGEDPREDKIGFRGVSALANGNYVVNSPEWNGGRGAVTWGDGAVGSRGVVGAGNSLVGTSTSDHVGGGVGTDPYGNPAPGGGVWALKNGNFAIFSPYWGGGSGAATWASGTGGTVGPVSEANSVVDFPRINIGFGLVSITPLPNGDFYALSIPGSYGASATWMSGADGRTIDDQHTVTPQNSVGFVNSGWVGGAIGVTPLGDGQKSMVGINNYPNFYNPVGFTDPNSLTFDWGQGQTVPMVPGAITRALAAGIDVTLEANNDLVIDSPIVVTAAGAPGRLTLKAGRSILINANIDTGGAGLSLIANASLTDGVIDGLRDPGNAIIKAAPGVAIDTRGGHLAFDLKNDTEKTNHGIGVVTLPVTRQATFTLTPSAHPSAPGQEVTFTFVATPVNSGDPTPTGSVVFSVNGSPSAPVTLAGGTAVFVAALPAGAHTIAAAYSSANNYAGGTAVHTQTVSPIFVDVAGPAGAGTAGYIGIDQSLTYRVGFTNASATSVREVFVTHPLDDNLDRATFELTSFGWGDTDVVVPPGLQAYATRVDAVDLDGSPLFVDVAVELDLNTGICTWTFQSVDPATGELPADPQDGFLLPNDPTGRGKGYVEYTIRLKSTAATDTPVVQQASVVFDDSVPVDSPPHSNTVDADVPAASVHPLPFSTSQASFLVSWDGIDPGGAGYTTTDVYVATDGGPYALWLDHSTEWTATYTGERGHRYDFVAVGRDLAGNVQSLAGPPQATTVFPDAPLAVDDAFTVAPGRPRSGSVLANDVNPAPRRKLTAVLVDGPTHGTVNLKPTGQFTYTPGASWTGLDSFTYKIRDNTGRESNVARVDLATHLVGFKTARVNRPEHKPTATLTVNLSAPAAAPVSVTYVVAAKTARGRGQDFTLDNGTIAFAPGEKTKTIVVELADDALDENDETLQVWLTTTTGPVAFGKDKAATITIRDNDAPPKVSFLNREAAGGEEQSPAVEVILSAPSSRPVTVAYKVLKGTATAVDDFAVVPAVLTFAPGETSKVLTVNVVDDALFENDETVKLRLVSPVNAALGRLSTHTYTIRSNDPAQLVGFKVAQVIGDAGGTAAVDPPPSTSSIFPTGVPYSFDGRAAPPGTDIDRGNGERTSEAGENPTAVRPTNDPFGERSESRSIRQSSPLDLSLGSVDGLTLTIDEDP